jgi:hypothetical protein
MTSDTLNSLAQGRRGKFCLGLALFAAVALAAGSAAQKSVTVDEFQALPHGLAIWRTGDLHLATGEHLLSIVLAAAPVALTPARFDTTTMAAFTSSWQCGAQFMRENAVNYHGYFLLGRLVSLACLLATCGLTYGYARSLYGPTAALVAATFACLSPNLLAHGPLITPDIYLACAVVGSLWAFDRLLRRPGTASAAVLGLALGLAAMCKLTGLLLFALFPAITLAIATIERLRHRREPGPPWRAVWLALLGALAVGVLVINVGFLGDGSLTPLGKFHFQNPTLRLVQEWLPGWLPVPLPYFYFRGIDAQLAESGYTAYLLGEFNESGFYHYYFVGLLVKTPLPVLLLCGMSFVCAGRIDRRDAVLLATAAALFIFFSLARHKNIGVRYVLFLEPLMAVWIGRLVREQGTGKREQRTGNHARGGFRHELNTQQGRRKRAWAVFGGGAALLVLTLLAWPNYLAYFNFASGGPDNGHHYLLDSNLDWGQDLITLRRYMETEGIDHVDLAYFGRVPPEIYGIHYSTLPEHGRPAHRYVAISANFLWGRDYIVNGDGNHWLDDPNAFRGFRRLRPKAVLGHTIYVFDMNRSDATSPEAS